VSKKWWNKERILAAIKERDRGAKSLAFTVAPAKLTTAARWHFGSWNDALAVAGIEPKSVRIPPRKYTKEEIVARIRKAAAAGSDLTTTSLAKHMKLQAVRREFGTVHNAIRAAGLGHKLERRAHGGQIWDRARVIATLRERAARKVYTLTPALKRVVQLYLGGAEEARRIAGVPSPIDVRIEQRRALRRSVRL